MNKILSFISRLSPLLSKSRLNEILVDMPVNQRPVQEPIAAGKPGVGANHWWPALERVANRRIFPNISQEAKDACEEIRNSYVPILEHCGVSPEEFFTGSIKNDEAEVLYQMVLERNPKVAYQIGTFVGYSGMVISHALRAAGGGILVAVDPEIPHRTFTNPVDVARRAAKNLGLSDFIRFVRGWHSLALGDYQSMGLKRKIPMVGLKVMQEIGGDIDFSFIDGDHSTVCTLSDFLLLKDFLNLNGVAVFHDAYSWPTVSQAIYLLWHDIYYYTRGTHFYFGLDTRLGTDGLIALERTAEELYPTLKLNIVNPDGMPVNGAKVQIPCVGQHSLSGDEGEVYVLAEIDSGSEIYIEHPHYQPHHGFISQGTNGDYVELNIELMLL